MNEKVITNETYKKYPNGPVPVHFEEFKEELVSEMKIREDVKEIFQGSKHNQFNYSSIKPLKS